MTSSDTTSTVSPLGRLPLGRLHRAPEAILPIGAHGSLDDRGQLVHAEDPAAQLALALALVEATVVGAGLQPADLAQLRVSATDLAAVLDVLDVLTDRLDEVGATPALSVVGVCALPVDGMLVALDGLALGTPRRPGRI
ncbi:Rid family hydrolase [Knoellia aerolata]|uniref:Endoribonuclease L-PSP n=1 Tax=Knoellia aerolata DSM 18566 TaxID=1385519 RepID=A0A0A0JY65_9MICO|nr:Rid family hydrolase [Knoellia aerolata]KGN41674.1 endoribonuclease L-PSP [Knoellia aerolata DSM 18566]